MLLYYRPFGEFCGGFRPDFIIAAFRERNESGIIYVHLAIFLAIERELKRKFDLNKVMTVIITECILLSKTVTYNVNPFKFSLPCLQKRHTHKTPLNHYSQEQTPSHLHSE